ncbi:MAG: hypothetical protein GXO62_07110 [Epsilonproteobacteria bacterium]|nr:hypothetical protein [Campylobacterota bacterium]
MNRLKYLWIGIKNAYNPNISKEYPVKNLWEITSNIENKFQKIDYETSKRIKKHSYFH